MSVVVHARVVEQLTRLRLRYVAERIDAMLNDAARDAPTYLDFLDAVLRQEVDAKQRTRTTMGLKIAHFPTVKTLDEFDFKFQPSVDQRLIRELASGQRRSLLFTRTKHAAKKLAKQLTIAGLPAVELHGNLSQQARARNLAAFSAGSARVLVATDIAARGIHVDEIGLVVHVDPPAECKAYLHRSGRTARAGAEGVVVTLSTPDQIRDVRTLTRLAGIKPVMAQVRPGAEQIAALTGPPAALVLPPAGAPVSTPALAPAKPRRRQGGVVEASRRGPRRPTRRRSTRRAAHRVRRHRRDPERDRAGHHRPVRAC